MGNSKVDEWDLQNSTQGISLFVGGLFMLMGLWGVFFSGLNGMGFQTLYSFLLIGAGGLLSYFGYKNLAHASFLTCTISATLFAILSLLALYNVEGFQHLRFTFMANYIEQRSADWILNAILSAVLFGGAIDWYRRYSKEKRTGIQEPGLKQVPPHRGKLIPNR